MDMIEVVRQILAGQKEASRILADHLEENHSSHKEFLTYHSRLLQPDTLRLQTAIDTVTKFGSKSERSEMAKMVRKIMRHKKRLQAKGTIRAYMKKKWSLQQEWFATQILKEELEVEKFLVEEKVRQQILEEKKAARLANL